MFKISIYKNSRLSNQASFPTMEELNSWFDFHKSNKTFGENEHSYEELVSEATPAIYEQQEVLVKEAVLDELGNELEPARVELQTVLVEEAKEAIYETIEVPAEYEVEIIDLSQDYEYQLAQVHANRKAEYPPMGDYLDAIVKGDQEQINEYIAKCLAVKVKYPLPVKL